MSGPPETGPIRVLVTFPAKPTDEELDRLLPVDERIELQLCGYEEPHAVRTARGRGQVVTVPPPDPVLVEQLSQAHVILALDLPQGVGELAPRLCWLQTAGAGIEHILRLGLPDEVTVTNAAGVAAVPIAEFVLARILGVWKRTAELDALQRAHRWRPTYGGQLAGSTLLVVGLGAIGTAVADRAAALGMEVLGIRRTPRPHRSCALVAGPEQLHELLGQADAVVVSAPATPGTADLFDAEAFAAMRPRSVFCNVARGSLVDERALEDSLRDGRLRAAILDVTRDEPLPAESPLWDLDNCFISAHSAPAPDRYVSELYGLFADNLQRWRTGGPLRNVVDPGRGY